MEIPSSEKLSDSPISVDQLSQHVRLFIDLVYCSNTATPSIDTSDFLTLLQICEQLQATELNSALWEAFGKSIPVNTSMSQASLWELFGLAAREDNHVACSRIIMTFHHKSADFDDLCSQPTEFYQGIPTRYLATLLTGNFRWNHKHAGDPAYKLRGFYSMAHRFATMKDGEPDLKIGNGRPVESGFHGW
jgi:hypothetical protein